MLTLYGTNELESQRGGRVMTKEEFGKKLAELRKKQAELDEIGRASCRERV